MTNMIGKIVEFFPDTQTATIQLLMSKIIPTEQSNFNSTTVAELVDVPCQFLKVSNFSITAPVKAGDIALVTFTKHGITHWLYKDLEVYRVDQGRPEPAALRRYSIQDSIAYVGLSNMVNPIENFNSDNLEIRNADGSQKMTLKPTGEIDIETIKYDKPNLPDAGAVKQSGSIISISKEGTYSSSVTEYDGEAIKTSVTIESDITGSMKINSLLTETNQSVEIDTSKAITIMTGQSTLTLNFDGTVNILAETKVNITSPDVELTGNLIVGGTATIEGNVRTEGRVSAKVDLSSDTSGSYNVHTHRPGTLIDSHAAPVTGLTGII